MRVFLILLFCCCLLSCKKEINGIDERLIYQIASEDIELPSKYSNLNLYVKCKNNKIGRVNVQGLRLMYEQSDKRLSFSDFLKVLLNQNQSVEESIYVECFSINTEIEKEYIEFGIDNLINKYFIKNKTTFLLKNDINETIKIILFLLFK